MPLVLVGLDRGDLRGRELLELGLQASETVVVVYGAPLVVGLRGIALPLGLGQTSLGVDRALGQIVELGPELLVPIARPRDHTLGLLLPASQDLPQVERQRNIVRTGYAGATVTPALASRIPKLSSPTDHRTSFRQRLPPPAHADAEPKVGGQGRGRDRTAYMAKGTRRV